MGQPPLVKAPSPKDYILLVSIDVKLEHPEKAVWPMLVIPKYPSSSNDVIVVLFLNKSLGIAVVILDAYATVIPVPSP